MNEQVNLHNVPPSCPEFLTLPSPAIRNKVPMVITAQPPSSCWLVKVACLAVNPEQWMGALRRTLQGGDFILRSRNPCHGSREGRGVSGRRDQNKCLSRS